MMSLTERSVGTAQKIPIIRNLKKTIIRRHIKINPLKSTFSPKIALMQLVEKLIFQKKLEVLRFLISKYIFYLL